MSTPHIERISIPVGSLAIHALPIIHYSDSYRIQLPHDAPLDVDHLYEKTFSMPSSSLISRMMRLRNAFVKRIGLKVVAGQKAAPPQPPFQAGDKTRFMKVFERTQDELLVGENDKHLDVRVSVLRQEHDNASWLVVTTVVQFNNWLGRLYFLPVRPFHQRIVPWMLKRAFQIRTAV